MSQLVTPRCTWVCGYSLGHKQPTNGYVLKAEWLCLSHYLSTANSSFSRHGVLGDPLPFLFEFWMTWSCENLVQLTSTIMSLLGIAARSFPEISISQLSSPSTRSYILLVSSSTNFLEPRSILLIINNEYNIKEDIK